MGWKISGSFPDEKKLVIVSVPHTSMWDYVLGRLSLFAFNVRPKILIKKEMFFFPLGWFLKRIGGIPVNRLEKNDIVEKLIREFNDSESLYLVITPE